MRNTHRSPRLPKLSKREFGKLSLKVAFDIKSGYRDCYDYMSWTEEIWYNAQWEMITSLFPINALFTSFTFTSSKQSAILFPGPSKYGMKHNRTWLPTNLPPRIYLAPYFLSLIFWKPILGMKKMLYSIYIRTWLSKSDTDSSFTSFSLSDEGT